MFGLVEGQYTTDRYVYVCLWISFFVYVCVYIYSFVLVCLSAFTYLWGDVWVYLLTYVFMRTGTEPDYNVQLW